MRTLCLRGSLLLLALAVGMGCGTIGKKKSSTTSNKTTASKSSTASKASSDDSYRRDGLVWSSRAYPTGDKRTSTLLLESGTPAEVIAGQSYNYVIKVTNLTDLNLDNVIVEDKPEGNFKLESSSPSAAAADGGMRWNIGNLRPNGSKTITVTGRPMGTGAVTHCCEVDWRSVVCNTTQVVQPALKLVKTGTPAALICDPIVYTLTVSNDGSGPARNVVINAPLPNGIQTLDGKSSQMINVGTLNAGQSKNYTIRAKATKTGRFNCSASAKGDGLTAKSGTVTTVVTQPKLTIEKTAPTRAFMGKNIDYKITVKNVGNGIAKNAMISDPVPAGTRFVSASAGGSNNGGVVSWNLGMLKAGETRSVTMRVRPDGGTAIRNTATAKAYCADAVTASTMTAVTGRPAILLEVIDEEDPIEVGGTVTYIIEATNQGTADGTNIKIVCNLEQQAEHVSSGGATDSSVSGRTITFKPLARLAPKAKARWRVVVKANAEGDVRFKVAMNSDQLTRPVDETEATQFYK